MIFIYNTITTGGIRQGGEIDASTINSAIEILQRKNLVVLDIKPKHKQSLLSFTIFERVNAKDLVIITRQLSTLFEAQVTVINSFKLISEQSHKELLGTILNGVVNDIQAGSTVSQSLSNYPKVFSEFFVNMVRIGEETGKLSSTFSYLADYLERQDELLSKAKHALVYPAFIITVFIAVMTLMFTVVIPKLTVILKEAGNELPIYTKIVIGVSNFFVQYGIFVALFLIICSLGIWRASLTEKGKEIISKIKYSLPGFGNLFEKFYLSRIADNLDATISSGIPMVRAIEITADVVVDYQYKKLLYQAREEVKGGQSLSKALSGTTIIPPIMVQMIKIGEETGKLGFVLGTVSGFYKREVESAIDTMIAMIEPVMIILLGLGVGLLLTAILMPIYDLASSY
jgi:type IV pilus assembly protein PilC